METGEFVARRSPMRLGLLLIGSLLFVALSAWLTFDGAVPGWKFWVVAAGMPFFGLCAVFAAMQFFAKGPEMVVGPRGIMWRRWTGQVVPWAAITAIQPVQVGSQQMLAIALCDPEAYPLGGLQGRLQGANRAFMGGGDVFLTLVGTDRRFDELVAAVARFAPEKLG